MAENKKDSEEEMEKYPLVSVRGLLLPSPFLVTDIVEEVMDYRPTEADIFIVTYPKCGTTWTQFLVWEIMHRGAVPPSPNQIMFQHCPFLEYTGTDVLETLPKPRVMKTHLQFQYQPFSPIAKYIYIVRSPWDCCVSYYYHHDMDPVMPKFSFDKYFDFFVKGEVGWGDFFDHVLSWYQHRNDPNVLFLTYEDMKKDTRKAIKDIARFLGESYYDDVQDEEVLENCLKHSDFKYMKDLGLFFANLESDAGFDSKEKEDMMKSFGLVERGNAQELNFREVQFFRKGIVGDWKNHFSVDQVQRFNDYMIRKLKNTEMENFWQPLQAETMV